ncbi:MAG: PAS domain-containing protein, partial [Desulfobacterales bacterium]
MSRKEPSIINIGLVGGGDLCKEILEKTTAVYEQAEMVAPILAVADPDPESPGRKLASQLGLLTFDDYRQLYDRRYSIHLIIILTPEPEVFDNILLTRPSRIRILAYQVFRMFWKAIGQEEQKLRERTKEMQTILDGIEDFILVISPQMEVVEANSSFLNKMGYTPEEVIGKKCHQVWYKLDHPCNDDKKHCPLQEVVRNKGYVHRIRRRILPNGQIRYYEVSVYPIWEKDGKITK